MFRLLLCWVLGTAMMLAGTAGASAQSFNVDLDVFAGGPSAGSPAPSAAFAGAAGQTGYWNQVLCTTSAVVPLLNTGGNLTSVQYKVVTGSGIGGGSGLQTTSGDFRLLMNDYANVPDLIVFRFTGFLPGRYKVYTYAIDAGNQAFVADVSITDSLGTITKQSGAGPMPANFFIEGVTHATHDIVLSTTVLEIIVSNHVPGPPNASVNGFQIVGVPEPASSLAVVFGLLPFLKKRRKI